jgi:membrane-bound metal-dependent hydrolase YbcI (DUF457 family)
MAFIFTHLIAGWLVGKIYEYFSKNKLSKYTWLFLLAGSMIPDLDLLADWFLDVFVHRTLTHSLPFAIIFSLFVYTILTLAKDKNSKQYSAALGIGIFVHILVDMNSTYGVTLLWPSDLYFSFARIGLKPTIPPHLFERGISQVTYFLKQSFMDASLGVLWIFYLGLKRRIRF